MTFFSSLPALGSGLFSFLSKGFANSTPGLAGVGVVGLGDASRLALRGVEAGLEENLELIFEIQLERRPLLAWFLTSLSGPLAIAPGALGIPPVLSALRRFVNAGRFVLDLEGSAAGAVA